MDWAYVNPFTGFIHFSNLKIYEQDSDSLFFSAKGMSVNISMSKLFFKTYEINSIRLDEPHGIINQNRDCFNFTDLIEKFSPEGIQDSLKLPVHFNILNVAVQDGEFQYVEKLIPINYSIKNVNFKSSGKYWNTDTINVKFSFVPGTGDGDVSGEAMLNLNNLDYRLDLVVHKLDLNIIEQYLKDLSNYGSFFANLDADVHAKGSLNNTEVLNLKGKIAITDFHFGKNPSEDYTSFEKLTVGINELDPQNKKYFFDTVLLAHPYFKYEQYDYLDNFQHMFGNSGAKVNEVMADPGKFNLIIEIAHYIKVVFKNFLSSDYTINHLAASQGDLKFYDYALNEKFSSALSPLSILADSVDNKKNRLKVSLESGVRPFGSLAASVSMNPKDNKDFDFVYKFQKIPAAVFNPYLITYTSFPLDRGTIAMSGNWIVRNDNIQSTNHFIVIDPRVTKRIRKKDTSWLPMPLIMAFIRERGNVIDYQIPITGNMKDPKFHLHDVLMDMLGNIFIKPSTTVYRMEVKNVENEIEKLLSLNWAMRQTKMISSQGKFVTKIAEFLKDSPEANITVRPFSYSDKEREYILFFEAKKKYFLIHEKKDESSMSENDSISIDKMSSKDSLFLKYLDHVAQDSMLFTIQEKCEYLVGKDILNRKFDQLVKEREHVFMEYFKANKTEKQVRFFTNENAIPFNGFSYFKIEYKGDIPKSLVDAYEKLNELNTESPRDKYLKLRKSK